MTDPTTPPTAEAPQEPVVPPAPAAAPAAPGAYGPHAPAAYGAPPQAYGAPQGAYGVPPQGAYPAGYAPTYAPRRWNVLSIVSLVSSLLMISIVGVITGHISLKQIKRTNEQGYALAILGLIFGYLGCALYIIVIALGMIPVFIGLAQG